MNPPTTYKYTRDSVAENGHILLNSNYCVYAGLTKQTLGGERDVAAF